MYDARRSTIDADMPAAFLVGAPASSALDEAGATPLANASTALSTAISGDTLSSTFTTTPYTTLQ